MYKKNDRSLKLFQIIFQGFSKNFDFKKKIYPINTTQKFTNGFYARKKNK